MQVVMQANMAMRKFTFLGICVKFSEQNLPPRPGGILQWSYTDHWKDSKTSWNLLAALALTPGAASIERKNLQHCDTTFNSYFI